MTPDDQTPDTTAQDDTNPFLAEITGEESTTPAPETPVEPNAFLDALTQPETPEAANPEPDASAKPETDTTQNPEDTTPEELPNATPKAAEHWKIVKNDLKKTREELRQERDRAATEIQKRDEELTRLREQTARVAELEEKAKFVDDAERELAISRVEGTREYKETIITPLKAIEEQAELIAKSSDVDVDRLIDAMTHPDPVKRRELLKEVTAGIDEMDKLDIKRMSDDAVALLQKRDQIRERAAEAQREQETVAKTRTEAEIQKARAAYKAQAENAVGELKKRVPFIPIVEGEDAEAVFGDIVKKASEIDFDSANPSTKAFAAAAGLVLPRVLKQLNKVMEENKSLSAKVAAGNTVRPSMGGGDPAPAQQSSGDFLGGIYGSLGLTPPRGLALE